MATNPNPFLRSPLDTLADDLNREAETLRAKIPAVPEPELEPVAEAAAPAPQPKPAASKKPGKAEDLLPPPELTDLFNATAEAYEVPVNVLMALAHQESRYKADAVGVETKWGKAKGMMQNLDATAKGLKIDAMNPNEAVPAAAYQIRQRIDKGMSMEDAVMEHFAGPDRKQWGEKTAQYGREVMEKVGQIGQHLIGLPKPPEPPAPGSKDANRMSTSMERSAYLDTFKVNNPQASPDALKMAMDQFDAEQALRAKATPVQDRFAQMADPNATFDAKLDAKLNKAKGIVPALPSVAQPEQVAGPTDTPSMVNDVQRGLRNLQALAYGVEGLSYDMMGMDKKAEKMLDRYVEITENNLRDNPAAIGTYKNVQDLGDAGRYAVEAVLENAAMIIPSLLTGGIGAAAAKKAAEKVVGGMVQKQIAQGIARSVAEKNALKFIAKRVTMGATAGAAASSVGMESGSIMGDIYAETGEMRAGTAAVGGIAAGLLDTIAPVMALRKIAGPVVDEAAGHVLPRLGAEVGKQFLTEAGTEGLQTLIEKASVRSVDGKVLFNAELADELIDATLKGGIGGAVMGGASQAVAEVRAPTPARMAPLPAEAAPLPASDSPLSTALSESASPAARVVAVTPQGQAATGTVTDYAENDQGQFNAEVVGDDGQVYQITEVDGLTLVPVAPEAGPLTSALAGVAAAEPVVTESSQLPATGAEQTLAPTAEIPAAEVLPVQAEIVPPQSEKAAAQPLPEAAAAPAEPTAVADMSDAQLRERMKYIAGVAKANGASKMTVSARREVEAEINRRAKAQPLGAANGSTDPVRNGDVGSGRTGGNVRGRGDNGIGSNADPAMLAEPPAGAEGAAQDGTGGAAVPGSAANQKQALKPKAAWQVKVDAREAKLEAQIATANANASARKAGKVERFNDETTGAHSGQTDHVLTMRGDDGKPVGKVEYTVYQGKPQISMIDVPAAQRRKGYGAELVTELQRKFPDVEIDWGGMTEDGTALRKALDIKQVPTADAPKFKRLEAARAERDALLDRAAEFQSIDSPTDDQRDEYFAAVEPLNDLHDEIADLESELSGQKPVKSLIAGRKPKAAAQPSEPQAITKEKPAAEKVPEVAPASKPKAKKPSPKKQAEERARLLDDRFTPGNIVKSYSGHDRVISYEPASEENGYRMNVRVQEVVKKDGEWVDAPRTTPRNHSTVPSDKELATGTIERARAGEEVKFSVADDYRDEHRPPSREDGAPLSDLTGGGTIYPADVYSANGPRYYGTGNDAMDKQAFRIASIAKGKPDFDVMIFRAVPSGVDAEIGAGDWVTINRAYADQHGEARFDGDYKILSKMVKASEIYTNGDSIQEWGYDPAEGDAKFSTKAHPFANVTRKEFLGDAKITPDSNSRDLRPNAGTSLDGATAEPFLKGKFTAKFSDVSVAIFDGEKVIASYDKWNTLVVDKKYRRQGIAEELVYQWRMRHPDGKTATHRTKASQKLQEKVWDRIQREINSAKFSTSTKPGALTTATLRKAINTGTLGPVVDSMVESGLIVLHDTTATLPKSIRGVPKQVQALTAPDGKVHMIASNLTPQNARAVMLHEAFHQGGEKLIGSAEWVSLMKRMASLFAQGREASKGGKANQFYSKARARVASAKEQGAVEPQFEAEEFAAYAIEEYESAPKTVQKWVDDLLGTVKAWLLARIGKQLGDVTPAQLSAIAKLALMDVAVAKRGEMFGPAGELFSTQEERRTRTIEVDGVRRPVEDSEGNMLGDEFSRQRDFWQWYADGPVDEQGRPMAAGGLYVNAGGESRKVGTRYSVAAADAPTNEDAEADTGLTPPDQGFLRRVQASIQDQMNRVKQVQEKIEKVTGQPLPEKMDYYLAETNRPGRIAARLEDGENDLFAPLMERMAKAGHTPDQLQELLHAMHAAERNETVARINPDTASGSGMTDEQAQALLAQYEGDEFKTLHRLADDARAIARHTLDLKLAYGLLTPERHEQLTTHYEFYVPLKGDGEYGVKVKQAMGHDARDEFIVENILRDFKQAVVAGEKNVARQVLLHMILKNPDEKLWSVGIPPKGRYIAGKVYEVFKGKTKVASFDSASAVAAFMEGKKGEAVQYRVLDSAGMQVAEFTKQLQDNEVMVYLKGESVRVQIYDEALAKQLRPLDRGQMNWFWEQSQKLNRYYSKIYTGYNPAFILRNAARDAMTGTINMMGNYGSVTAAKAWAKYPQALAVLGYWATTGKIPKGATGDMLRAYRDHGGKVGASHMGDLEAQGVALQRIYEDAKGALSYAGEGKIPKAAWIAARKAIHKLARVVEIANQATENALRLALFMEMRAQGESTSKAAQAAKTVTVDFDRKGASTAALSAAYLFFNPAIQGSANGIKTLAKGKHRMQAWGAMGGLAVLGYWLASKGMDEDKDRWLGEKWDIRTKNLIINGKEHQVRVPMSQEFAPFFAFGHALAEVSRGEKASSVSVRMVSAVLDAYIPLRGAYDPDSDNHGADLLLALVPSIGQMPAQLAMNRNSFGSQIVPENNFTENRPGNLKMNRATKNSTYDKAAQKIAAGGVALGAGRYENDITKVSPETLKLLWANFTGGLGTFVADTVGVAAMAPDSEIDITIGEIPIAKDFVRNQSVKPLRSRYFELTKEARTAIDEFKEAKKAGDGEAIDAILADEGKMEALSLDKMMKADSKAAKEMRELAVDINADTTLTAGQKRARLKELEQEEEALYRDAIKAFQE